MQAAAGNVLSELDNRLFNLGHLAGQLWRVAIIAVLSIDSTNALAVVQDFDPVLEDAASRLA
jgi:hypothetical protein